MSDKEFLEAVERHIVSPKGEFPLTPLSVYRAYQDRPIREVEEILAAGSERRARAEQERQKREEGGRG